MYKHTHITYMHAKIHVYMYFHKYTFSHTYVVMDECMYLRLKLIELDILPV